jgi:imidazolonepropionase-like amidohydrolase
MAGLTPEQMLRAIGVNAAAALRADPFLGRIATGAAADLVFVDGDPLMDINKALNVVAVVRNGRFFSLSGLKDRAEMAKSVE